MTIPIAISTTTTTRFGRGPWREVSAEGWGKGGDFFHEEILPKHFTVAGAFEYGYQPRGFKYNKQKQASKGHREPLVYKGDLRRMLLRLRDVRAHRARGSSEGGVDVKLSGPRYLHQRQQPRQPNLALEISTVSSRDAEAIAAVVEAHATEALNRGSTPIDVEQEQN